MYNEQGSITFLDVGLTVQLEREDRDNFLDLFRVVLRGQGREAGRLILERSKENNCEDPELFYDEMESIVNDALSQDGGLRDVRSCISLSPTLSNHKTQTNSSAGADWWRFGTSTQCSSASSC